MSGILAAFEVYADVPSWTAMLRQLSPSDAIAEEWLDVNAGVSLAHVADGPATPESSLFVGERVVVIIAGRLLPARAGSSDAKRVAEAYLRHGPECSRHLQGEFSFVVWDRMERRAVAGCDPVGLRSIAYCSIGDTLLLSSRALALLCHPRVPKRLNGTYLAHALCDFWTQAPGSTPFSSIQRLRPGFALFHQNGSQRLSRVDRLIAAPNGGSRWTFEESVSRFWSVLEQGVRDAASGESSIAVELSSGLDSTAVTLCAEKIEALRSAFSAVAPASGVDERDLIEGFVSQHPRLLWNRVDCSAGATRGEPRETLPVPDDPCVLGAAFLPAKLSLARAARDLGCRVLLDGEGGDEIFALAPRLGDLLASGSVRAALDYMRGRGWRSSLVRELFVPWMPAIGRRIWAASERLRRDPFPEWMSAEFRETLAAKEALRDRAEWLRHRRAADALPALLEIAPTVGSRQAMRLFLASVGMRSRSPFFDRRVLELALALPAAALADPRRSKMFLRLALRGRVPSAIVEQPKNERLYLWLHAIALTNRDFVGQCSALDKNPILTGFVHADVLKRSVCDALTRAPFPMAPLQQVCALFCVSGWLVRMACSVGCPLDSWRVDGVAC